MIVGFTGTRYGMPTFQLANVHRLLKDAKEKHGSLLVRHGDCIGADAQFHEIARKLGLYIIVHPPKDPKLRAYCKGDEILEPEPYLERDVKIVQYSDYLIGAPRSRSDTRGGTWYTIFTAARMKRFGHVVMPDGVIAEI